jgi:hypothetical protein
VKGRVYNGVYEKIVDLEGKIARQPHHAYATLTHAARVKNEGA